MFALIEEYDRDNLYQSWVWLRLAQLLGDDFTQDDLRAIHENDDGYDDDVGGPLYVAGREGIEQPPLAPELASKAEEEAQRLFAQNASEALKHNPKTRGNLPHYHVASKRLGGFSGVRARTSVHPHGPRSSQ